MTRQTGYNIVFVVFFGAAVGWHHWKSQGAVDMAMFVAWALGVRMQMLLGKSS